MARLSRRRTSASCTTGNLTVDFDGRPLRIIDLQTLIAIKAGTGRAKDRLVVPVLLELARRRASDND